MKKTWRVQIKAFATVIVEARSKTEALDVAVDQCRLGDLCFDEAEVKGKVSPDEIDAVKRHCELFIPEEAA